MSIVAKQGVKREAIPEGSYAAVCTRVIDLGDQFSQMYGKSNHKVMFCWEIPECTVEVDGKQMPRMISRDFTLSLGDKAILRGFLEAWRGVKFTDEQLAGFDLKNILGAPCFIQVIHSESGYERINSIMRLPSKIEKPEPATELLYVDFDAPDFLEMLDKLPDWIRDRVKASPQYKEIVNAKTDDTKFTELDDDGEDLPF